ncbi:hypothetical protein RND71_019252 [Anisodus tanguticus]|uniref:Uncharacterized protein n=1 Tax=Anisodus tanguticus TaxID=243964 RepID=A0AAE1RZ13_9SOLA|nr:hypothetical protein RND71_019252 [Anisodus tanguticus]
MISLDMSCVYSYVASPHPLSSKPSIFMKIGAGAGDEFQGDGSVQYDFFSTSYFSELHLIRGVSLVSYDYILLVEVCQGFVLANNFTNSCSEVS